jgi:hypothetical protein
MGLTLRETQQFTPVALQRDVQFSSPAARGVGIARADGVLVVTERDIRFYEASPGESLVLPIANLREVRLGSARHQSLAVELLTRELAGHAFDAPAARDRFVETIAALGVRVLMKAGVCVFV